MASQASITYIQWLSAFHAAMAAVADFRLKQEEATFREALQRVESFYESVDLGALHVREQERIRREGLQLALQLERLTQDGGIDEASECGKAIWTIIDEAEDFSIAMDPELLRDVETARQELKDGATIPLGSIRER